MKVSTRQLNAALGACKTGAEMPEGFEELLETTIQRCLKEKKSDLEIPDVIAEFILYCANVYDTEVRRGKFCRR